MGKSGHRRRAQSFINTVVCTLRRESRAERRAAQATSLPCKAADTTA